MSEPLPAAGTRSHPTVVVIHHKLGVRAAAGAFLGFTVWWLLEEGSPQAAVGVAMAMLAFASSLRALVVLRDEAVERRTHLGWDKQAVRLDALSAVSLRHEGRGWFFPLVLRLSEARGSQFDMRCWAWAGWREVAHRAGHFARRLDAQRDEVTEARLACRQDHCEWDQRVAVSVGDRRAEPAPECDTSGLNLMGVARQIAVLFAFGFTLGLFGVWVRDDPELGPLLPVAIGSGGFFVVVGLIVLLWDNAKR